MKRYIRSSVDPEMIADLTRISPARYNTAVKIEWKVSEDDANRLINGVCKERGFCGYLPLKDSFVCVEPDGEGITESKGYLKGFVVTDSYGDKLYYGIANDHNQNIEYVTRRKGRKA